MENPELDRIAEIVGRGLVARDRAEVCLRAWQAHRKAGREVSLGDLFVQARLLTPTQAAVLSRAGLVERQPFRNRRP